VRPSRQLTAIVYAACGIVWGTTWFAIRRCIGEGGYPAFTSAAIRFAIASMVLGGTFALGFGRPGPRGARQVGAIVGCGLLSAASYGLIYLAEQSISGGVACTLYGTFPLFTALFATIGGIERVSRQALVGALVSFAGIAIVFGDRLGVSRAQAVGVLLVLGSVMVSALYTTILKHVAHHVNPLATTCLFLATSVLPLGALGAAFDRKPVPWPPPLVPTAALLYLAVVGSAFVFGAYFYLIKHVTLMTAATLVLVEPIVALSVDAIGERDVVLGARAWVGIGVTLVGIAVSVLQRQAPAPELAAPPG
jgi:drug/metabolite transporter (DMT)-like permease